jgi:two-component system sensor histidine kinase UhpB
LSSQHGVMIEFREQDVPAGIPSDIAMSLFGVMQEILRIAISHGEVDRVLVALNADPGEIRLEITSEGAAIDPEAAVDDDCVGLAAMRDRLSLVGGACEIESRPGGTRIRVRAPLHD